MKNRALLITFFIVGVAGCSGLTKKIYFTERENNSLLNQHKTQPQKPEILFSSNCTSKFTPLIGPYIIVPLPILPWPPEIYRLVGYGSTKASFVVEAKSSHINETSLVNIHTNGMTIDAVKSDEQQTDTLVQTFVSERTCMEMKGKELIITLTTDQKDLASKIVKLEVFWGINVDEGM